jgi:hypothetical protein
MNRQPFAAIEVLLIDGNNLLHRRSGAADPSALRGLLPRLSAVVPGTVSAIVMLDGMAAPSGGRTVQVRRGLEIRHAGSRSADDALLAIIADSPIGSRAMMTLVTDDRALTEKARHLGCHTARLDWLETLLSPGQQHTGQSRPVSLGNRRPPRPPPHRNRA